MLGHEKCCGGLVLILAHFRLPEASNLGIATPQHQHWIHRCLERPGYRLDWIGWATLPKAQGILRSRPMKTCGEAGPLCSSGRRY